MTNWEELRQIADEAEADYVSAKEMEAKVEAVSRMARAAKQAAWRRKRATERAAQDAAASATELGRVDLFEALKLCEAVLTEHEKYDDPTLAAPSREGEALEAARNALAKVK